MWPVRPISWLKYCRFKVQFLLGVSEINYKRLRYIKRIRIKKYHDQIVRRKLVRWVFGEQKCLKGLGGCREVELVTTDKRKKRSRKV